MKKIPPKIDLSIGIKSPNTCCIRDVVQEEINAVEKDKPGSYEFEISMPVKGYFENVKVAGTGKIDYRRVECCISGLASVEINRKDNKQHFFWSYTCLSNSSQSLTFDYDDVIAIEVIITNRN
jgi:hypothetical protein